jgi:hypothetical protein
MVMVRNLAVPVSANCESQACCLLGHHVRQITEYYGARQPSIQICERLYDCAKAVLYPSCCAQSRGVESVLQMCLAGRATDHM